MHIKINPDNTATDYQDELAALSALSVSGSTGPFIQAGIIARRLPGGYIKKIVWDAEGGYPEHAWGYTQFSPRPYLQGYGCDGTTDGNIHLIAATLCGRLGIDYAAAYAEAYRSDTAPDEARDWVADLLADNELADETVIPKGKGRKALSLALQDLYQINNRSLVEVLEESLRAAGKPTVSAWVYGEAA